MSSLSPSAGRIEGRFLVQGVGTDLELVDDHDADSEKLPDKHILGVVQTPGTAGTLCPLLVSDVSLSFWGGINPETGIVIDTSHPWAGHCVSDKIICLPSGRGSCTASQVLLELILEDKAPAAIVLRDPDGLVCVGALVAQEIFQHKPIPDIICLGKDGFTKLLEINKTDDSPLGGARVLRNGHLELVDDWPANRKQVFDHDYKAEHPIELTLEEERKLKACQTEAERMALRVIFRYARIVGAVSDGGDGDKEPPKPSATSKSKASSSSAYLPISMSHIDGCTYIGPGGFDFVKRLVDAGGKVKVPTTLNSVSTDRERWKKFGIPDYKATPAIATSDAYLMLGCQPSFTCAPYLLPDVPKLGQNIAFGESNAVVYANSFLGARTEKYADYLDICCAIAGIVPAAGVHLEANRRPKIVLDGAVLFSDLKSCPDALDFDLLWPTLGHLCGTLSDGRVPILLGLEKWNVTADHMKAFCAAFGTTASSPLIHIAGITPEAKNALTVAEFVTECGENIKVLNFEQLHDTFTALDAFAPFKDTVDLVALGNPHLSVSEIKDFAALIDSSSKPAESTAAAEEESSLSSSISQKHPDTRIIACMSRSVHKQADRNHLNTMRDFGIEFVFDTCWCMLLDKPIIPENPNATILTNSGKYAHYAPGLTNRGVRFGSMSDCIYAARTGVYPNRTKPASGEPPRVFLASQQRRSYSSSSSRSSRRSRSNLQALKTVLRRWR